MPPLLARLVYFHILGIICEARQVILEHRELFSCPEHTFVAFGRLFVGAWAIWGLWLVLGWISKDFWVSLEVALNVNFKVFRSKRPWVELLLYFFW